MLKAVNHIQISIPIGGESAARLFYCTLLGLREVAKPTALAGRGGFWAELAGIQLHFGVEDGIDRAATRAHITYEVADLATVRTTLTSAGITVKDGDMIPGVKRIEIRDPFGNRIELLEKITAGSEP